MTVRVEGPRPIGSARIAVLFKQSVEPRKVGGFVHVTAEKHPIAVVVGVGDRVGAARTDGAAMQLDEVERLCPGLLAKMA